MIYKIVKNVYIVLCTGILLLCIFGIYCEYKEKEVAAAFERAGFRPVLSLDNNEFVGFYVYDWWSGRISVNIYTGESGNNKPLRQINNDTFNFLEKIKITEIVVSGEQTNRLQLERILQLNVKYMSIFFDYIEGESTMCIPLRYFKRFEICYISGLNEQEIILLTENFHAEEMTIRRKDSSGKFDNTISLSAETFTNIVTSNRSKNITLCNISITDSDEITQCVRKVDCNHRYNRVILGDCHSLSQILEIIEHVNIDELILYFSESREKDFEKILRVLRLHEFKNAQYVTLILDKTSIDIKGSLAESMGVF